jgi:biotin carboxylase
LDKSVRQQLLVCGFGHGMERSLAKIDEMDIDVVAVGAATANGVRHYRTLPADPGNAECVLAALREADIRRIDGVMSLGFDNPPVVAKLCRILGCPGLSEQAAENCTFKDRRIRILRASGLATPGFSVVDNVRDALSEIARMGFPVVVKPADRTNSVGVAKVESIAMAVELAEEAFRMSGAGRIVIEQFLAGTEHTVSGFSTAGHIYFTGISDRDYSRKEEFAPYFFERGDIVPTALDSAMAGRVMDTVSAGVRALQLDPAVFNTDVLITPEGAIYLIEVTGRMTGARIATEVVPLATGVDPLPNAVRLALNRPLEGSELTPTRNRVAVQRYVPARGGVVEWVGDIEQVPKPPGVYDLFWGMDLKAGQRVRSFQSNDDIIAGAITTGDTVDEASELADRILEQAPIRWRA